MPCDYVTVCLQKDMFDLSSYSDPIISHSINEEQF